MPWHPYKEPTKCPKCGQKIKVVRFDNCADYYCSNPKCPWELTKWKKEYDFRYDLCAKTDVVSERV